MLILRGREIDIYQILNGRRRNRSGTRTEVGIKPETENSHYGNDESSDGAESYPIDHVLPLCINSGNHYRYCFTGLVEVQRGAVLNVGADYRIWLPAVEMGYDQCLRTVPNHGLLRLCQEQQRRPALVTPQSLPPSPRPLG